MPSDGRPILSAAQLSAPFFAKISSQA